MREILLFLRPARLIASLGKRLSSSADIALRVYHGTMSTIVFIGLRCSGKSTLGHWLAGELGIPFLDTDDFVLERLGFGCVQDAWDSVGEEGWRGAETKVIPPLLKQEAIISCGGGAPMIPLLTKALSSMPIVLNLVASEEETACRVQAGRDRPTLSTSDAEIRMERLPLYSMLATCEIDTSGPIEESKSQILAFLQNPET